MEMRKFVSITTTIGLVVVVLSGCGDRQVVIADYGPALQARHGVHTAVVSDGDGKVVPYADIIGGEAVDQPASPGVAIDAATATSGSGDTSADKGGVMDVLSKPFRSDQSSIGINIEAKTARAVTVCQTHGIFSESSGECMAAVTQKTTAERVSDFCTASPENAKTPMCEAFVRGQQPRSTLGTGGFGNRGDRWGCGGIRYPGDERTGCWSGRY
jgi:hypothetical protein